MARNSWFYCDPIMSLHAAPPPVQHPVRPPFAWQATAGARCLAAAQAGRGALGGMSAPVRRILQTSAEYFLAPLPGAEAPPAAHSGRRPRMG
jgi:hypothetical protein